MNLLSVFQTKNDKFYAGFEQAADNNLKAAKELVNLFKNYNGLQKSKQHVDDLEHKGDEICHDIYRELDRSFITPIDREDITALVKSLDDVIDLIHASIEYLDTYGVQKPTPVALSFAEVILESAKIIQTVIPKLRKRNTFSLVRDSVTQLHQLENKADKLLHTGLRGLFKNPKDPIEVIKWEKIYQTMEEVTDKCEDIADVLRSIITKYA